MRTRTLAILSLACTAASACVHPAVARSEAAPGSARVDSTTPPRFYHGAEAGSESAFNPVTVVINEGFDILQVDGDGRIVLPEALRTHAGLSTHVAFVGLGSKFQMWEPARFEERRARAREKVHEHRRLFGAGTRLDQGDRGGEGGARE